MLVSVGAEINRGSHHHTLSDAHSERFQAPSRVKLGLEPRARCSQQRRRFWVAQGMKIIKIIENFDCKLIVSRAAQLPASTTNLVRMRKMHAFLMIRSNLIDGASKIISLLSIAPIANDGTCNGSLP